jgi:hypothetical protein
LAQPGDDDIIPRLRMLQESIKTAEATIQNLQRQSDQRGLNNYWTTRGKLTVHEF